MEDKLQRRLSRAAVVSSAGAADLVAQASGSPILAGILGATAAAINVGVEGANRRRLEKVAIAATVGAQELGSTVDAMIEDLLQNDVKAELLAAIFEGAARAIDRRKLVMLGHSLATGANTDDGTVLHHEVFMAKLISDLELPHLRILEYMDKDPKRDGYARLATLVEILELHEPQVLSFSLLATLLRHALLQGYSRDELQRLFTESTRLQVRVNEIMSDPVVYMITTLGTYTLRMYRGDAVPTSA